MYLINTTFHTHQSVAAQVFDHLVEQYLPEAMNSGLFSAPILSRLLLQVEEGAESFALQLQCPGLEAGLQWIEGPGAAILEKMRKAHGGEAVVWFTTPMEVVKC